MDYSLVILLAVPLLGAIVTAFVPERHARYWALAVSLLAAAAAIWCIARFDFAVPQDIQLVYGTIKHIAYMPAADSAPGIESIGFTIRLGADSISLWLVALTVLLAPLSIAASFDAIRQRQREYYAWMLALLFAMLGVFIARDLLLFYVFFELTLIPMFFIIGIWGGPERRRAAGKFFLFTFAGSIFTLIAVLYLGFAGHAGGRPASFDMTSAIQFAQHSLSPEARRWIALGLLAGFAVKVPLFPVHTWLPLAHTEAPTAGSVILAGVLLKLGTYGILRLVVPVGMVSGDAFVPALLQWMAIICIIGILYGALVAWVQQDIKKLVAYSSVSHLGFCVLGLVALNDYGMQGSVLYMINHGLSTGALFLVVGMIYDRYHTRDINALSGLARRMPVLAFFFVLFALSSIGLPGLNGFVSEFLSVLGAFKGLGPGYGAVAALGVILGAVYMLHMVARVIWGPLRVPETHEAHGQEDAGQGATPGHPADSAHDEPQLKTDLGGREVAILVPLALAVVLLGVVPGPLLKSLQAPLEALRKPLPAAVVPPRLSPPDQARLEPGPQTQPAATTPSSTDER